MERAAVNCRPAFDCERARAFTTRSKRASPETQCAPVSRDPGDYFLRAASFSGPRGGELTVLTAPDAL